VVGAERDRHQLPAVLATDVWQRMVNCVWVKEVVDAYTGRQIMIDGLRFSSSNIYWSIDRLRSAVTNEIDFQLPNLS
jgi:hypothetical protein